MLVRYVNSHIRALIDTFPDIGLQRDLFVGISKKVTLPSPSRSPPPTAHTFDRYDLPTAPE